MMYLIKKAIFNLIKIIDIKPKVNFQESDQKAKKVCLVDLGDIRYYARLCLQ